MDLYDGGALGEAFDLDQQLEQVLLQEEAAKYLKQLPEDNEAFFKEAAPPPPAYYPGPAELLLPEYFQGHLEYCSPEAEPCEDVEMPFAFVEDAASPAGCSLSQVVPSPTVYVSMMSESVSDDEESEEYEAKPAPQQARSRKTPRSRTQRASKKAGKWTKIEDQKLLEGIKHFGDKNWKDVSAYVGTRTSPQCLHRWKQSLHPCISRAKWTDDEDVRLIAAVKVHQRHWSLIAQMLGQRTGAQCRERYCNKLDPAIVRSPWTHEEDEKLRLAVEECGEGHWSQVGKAMDSKRTDYQIRKRWFALSGSKK
eukprot:TRINITY_DN1240_c0_g1_i1.p1 TRINITY_DN1240_c0_g1~~TRINITY_DN1240_c0_g1_i1.p1  ORF type:complete len:309 (-),score=45.13 TRINITY_DN1240_c0_g1_i1:1288-2214(-)